MFFGRIYSLHFALYYIHARMSISIMPFAYNFSNCCFTYLLCWAAATTREAPGLLWIPLPLLIRERKMCPYHAFEPPSSPLTTHSFSCYWHSCDSLQPRCLSARPLRNRPGDRACNWPRSSQLSAITRLHSCLATAFWNHILHEITC